MNGKEEANAKIDRTIKSKLQNYPVIVSMYYDWLIKTGKSYRTAQVYVNVITKYIDEKYSVNAPQYFFRETTPDDISQFINSRISTKKGSVAGSASNDGKAMYWSALNLFFQYLTPRLIKNNPVEKVTRPSIKKDNSPVYLTVSETNQLFENVQKYAREQHLNRDLAILMLGLLCGIRLSEIVQLNISDIDWDAKQINIHSDEEEDYSVPINYRISKQLELWLSDREEYDEVDTDALFISQRRQRLSDDAVSKMILHYSVGIEKAITPQVMRNTCVVNLYQSTGDLVLCSKLLNHKSTSTTQRYIEQLLSDRNASNAVDVLSETLLDQGKKNTTKSNVNIPPKAMQIIQNAPLTELDISGWQQWYLVLVDRLSVRTIGDLCKLTEDDLLCVGVSKYGAAQIKDRLSEIGCKLVDLQGE